MILISKCNLRLYAVFAYNLELYLGCDNFALVG